MFAVYRNVLRDLHNQMNLLIPSITKSQLKQKATYQVQRIKLRIRHVARLILISCDLIYLTLHFSHRNWL